MGARGRRSAADLATPRPDGPDPRTRVDVAALAQKNGMTTKQVMRLVRKAEKSGEVYSRIVSGQRLEWFWSEKTETAHDYINGGRISPAYTTAV